MEIKGKIIQVMDARSGESQNGRWAMQDFVIEFPVWGGVKHALLTISGEDRIKAFCPTVTGETLNFHFDIDARKWTGKDGRENWTNSMRCYRIDAEEKKQNEQAPAQTAQPAATANDPFAAQGAAPMGDAF